MIGGVKVIAMFHQLGAESAHGCIFFAAIASRHNYHGAQAEMARCECL
jgi:hypothetical protein